MRKCSEENPSHSVSSQSAGDRMSSEPVLPRAAMHLVPPDSPVEGGIVSTTPCLKGKSASFVRHVAIDVCGTPLAGRFLAGQSFGVVPQGMDEHGRPHRARLYSIACPSWGEDGRGNVLSTIVERFIDERKPQRPTDDVADQRLFLGVCSNYLCDRRVGDTAMITGPRGKQFLLPASPNEHDYLFVATGTGISPFRGMVMELLDHPKGACPSRIRLVMGSPYTTDLVFDAQFRGYEARHRNFKYYTAISREPIPGSGRGKYVGSVIEEHLDDDLGELLAGRRTLIYICGAAGMQFGVFRLLVRHGLAGAYLKIKDDELAGMPADEWPVERMERRVRPTKRCMLEVY